MLSAEQSSFLDVDRALSGNIIRHPEQYFVNVYIEEFLSGAVREQERLPSLIRK